MTPHSVTPSTSHARRQGRRLPGDPDLWVFIFAELTTFGAFFIVFMIGRANEVALFNASQLRLDLSLGTLNTVFLISSSWAVAVAVDKTRSGRPRIAPYYLALAIGLALAFIAVKYFEYSSKLHAGITMLTDNFFMFYYILTMIHLGHVVAGTVVLIVLWKKARSGAYGPGQMRGIEAGASYWHLVDLLWIFLFTLLYLLR